MSNPTQRYQQDLKAGLIQADPVQRTVVRALTDLHRRLGCEISLWQQLKAKLRSGNGKASKGLYLWGGVGIGKTYLMDLFFDSLVSERKLRLHFHSFMRQVHSDLKRLQGESDPLKVVAREFSLHADVICFDEFFVSDITDAMLLAGLFEALYERGICVVFTSNVPPDELYRNGLQRGRFLPAIELIKKHNTIIHMPSEFDYRVSTLENVGVYHTPLGGQAEQEMRACFDAFTKTSQWHSDPIIIENRSIPVVRCGSDVVWFDFDVICKTPRSQIDYIEIAEAFSTVLISNIPQLTSGQDDRAVYLIRLIDVFYDAKVRLIVSAATSIETLYEEGNLTFEFQRTQSRLTEMQSPSYWHQRHA